MPGSYTTYLESYEMPYIYISPEGTLADLLTAAHEYGHFVDGYVNCNQTFSIDCSEVFSQALEYLTLGSTSLGFAARQSCGSTSSMTRSRPSSRRRATMPLSARPMPCRTAS